MSYSDPYQAYVEGSVAASHPIRLVVTLYEAGIEAVKQAKSCFETGDVFGRSRAVTRAFRILTELTVSLDHSRGGDISANLKRLYAYMQAKVLEAHTQKTEKPLDEVAGLMTTLLESWRAVADQEIKAASNQHDAPKPEVAHKDSDHLELLPYGGYFYEPVESFAGVAATF